MRNLTQHDRTNYLLIVTSQMFKLIMTSQRNDLVIFPLTTLTGLSTLWGLTISLLLLPIVLWLPVAPILLLLAITSISALSVTISLLLSVPVPSELLLSLLAPVTSLHASLLAPCPVLVPNCVVHCEGASVKLKSSHFGFCFLGFLSTTKGHEGVTFRLVGDFIDDDGALSWSELL